MHAHGLTGSESSSTRPEASFRSTKKARVGGQCRPGEKQGGSPKQMVSAAGRNVPQTSSQGLRAMSNGSLKPSWRVFMAAASFRENPQQAGIARAQSHVVSKSVSKSGSRCSELKPNKEARSVERKVGFFSDVCNQREGRLLSKGQLILLPLTSSEQELLKGIFRVV